MAVIKEIFTLFNQLYYTHNLEHPYFIHNLRSITSDLKHLQI